MKGATIKTIKTLSKTLGYIKNNLFFKIEEALHELTDKQRQLIEILEIVRIEDFVVSKRKSVGSKKSDRKAIARAFVFKAFYNIETNVSLIEILKTTPNLRRICGFESVNHIPSESTFSRVFREFAETNLPAVAHCELIKNYLADEIVMHISRDSTAIEAREKVVSKPKYEKNKPKEKRKRGRPKKGEEKLKEPKRLERQQNMTLEEMLEELPKKCDFGCKKNSDGKIETWKGYKFHIDWADCGIPISCILTSASLHDSQSALPLAEMTSQRVINLYDLMDAAYDSEIIKNDSIKRNHLPIIDSNPRNTEKIEMEPAKKERYKNRSTAERGFSRLKDEFGARKIRVRGNKKIFAQLMFAILVLAADQLIKLADEIIERSETQEIPSSKAA